MSYTRDAFGLLGVGLIGFGIYSLSHPIGYVFGGLILIAITVCWSWYSVNRPRN